MDDHILNRIDNYLQEVYQEDPTSSVTHDGEVYSVNTLLNKSVKSPIFKVDISEISWVLKHVGKLDPKRVAKADLQYPVLITKWKGKWLVLDGTHRLQKAVKLNKTQLPARLVRPMDLKAAKRK